MVPMPVAAREFNQRLVLGCSGDLPPYDRVDLLRLHTTFPEYVGHALLNSDSQSLRTPRSHNTLQPLDGCSTRNEYAGHSRESKPLITGSVNSETGMPLIRLVESIIRTLTVDLESGMFRLGAGWATGDMIVIE